MAAPSVTYSNLINGATSDADQIDTNFQDLINGLSDGTKDLTINALTCNGNVTLKGNTTIGDATSDTCTLTATLTSNLIFTDATYDIGASGATRPRDLFLSRNAVIGGQLKIADGTSGSPGLIFSSDTDLGIYRIGSNNMGLISSGSTIITITTSSTSGESDLILQGATSSTADQALFFLASGDSATEWIVGRDTSDSAKFKITGGTTALGAGAGANDWVVITTGGLITLGVGSSTTHRLNITTQTTVGAAGGASALPATPTGYLLWNINGTNRAIPFYAAS